MKFSFSRQIFEKYSNSNFIKIRSVGAELFYADRQRDGQTDRRRTHMRKLIIVFAIFRTQLKIIFSIY